MSIYTHAQTPRLNNVTNVGSPIERLWDDATNGIPIVDITSKINKEEDDNYRAIYTRFINEVEAMVELLLNTNAVALGAISLGKDSMIVLLILLEAYKRCKEQEPSFNKPLVINTVDTLQEEIPLQMYVAYTVGQVEHYCELHGINLTYNKISPNRLNSFLFRYVGARNFLNNATRNGDCTDLFKLTPARKQLKKNKDLLGNTIIEMIGSRQSESTRRAKNMKKQSIYERTIDDVRKLHAQGERLVTYAPIREWTFQQVFGALHISGNDALVEYSGKPIPSFQPHAGLLIEIYGDAAAPETCSVNSSGQAESGSPCGTSNPNRMGCTLCTMVTENKSGIRFAEKRRWSALHIDKALRIRDYLYRLSMSENSRAFHARAFDPVLNRVMLQENTLKPALLEKVYRLLCQLTKDSQETASEIRFNGVHNFSGYLDIKNDPYMPAKTKQEFLKMYAQQATIPQYRFVEKEDAILLSYVWALDGVASLPYTPIAIYDQVNQGKRIAYPKLNSEMPDKVKLKSRSMNEAFAINTMSESYIENEYLDVSLYDIYGQQDAYPWLNCASEIGAKKRMDATVYFDVNINPETTMLNVSLNKVFIKALGKYYPIERFCEIEDELRQECENHADLAVEHLRYKGADKKTLIALITKRLAFKNFSKNGINIQLRNINTTKHQGVPNPTPRKASGRHLKESTKRVRKAGKPTTTRLRFYQPRIKSKLSEQHDCSLLLLGANLESSVQYDGNGHNEYSFDDAPLDSLYLDTEIYELYWNDLDGWERACRTYYEWRDLRLSARKTTRIYAGGEVLRQCASFGGITVAPSSAAQIKRIRTRTDVFAQANAYKYHSMTRQQLEKFAENGELIKMKDHRRDKARHLLKIRAARTRNRRLIRSMMENPIETCELTIRNKIKALHSLVSDVSDDKAPRFIRSFYSPLTRSFGAFEKELCNSNESVLLTKNEHLRMMLVREFDNVFGTESKEQFGQLSSKQQANVLKSLI